MSTGRLAREDLPHTAGAQKREDHLSNITSKIILERPVVKPITHTKVILKGLGLSTRKNARGISYQNGHGAGCGPLSAGHRTRRGAQAGGPRKTPGK